jgi:hypothetical protein
VWTQPQWSAVKVIEMTSNLHECDKPSTKLEGTLTRLHTIIMETSTCISRQPFKTFVARHGAMIVFRLAAAWSEGKKRPQVITKNHLIYRETSWPRFQIKTEKHFQCISQFYQRSKRPFRRVHESTSTLNLSWKEMVTGDANQDWEGGGIDNRGYKENDT